MTQKDRINDFVSRLLDSQLTDGQCAFVLGEDNKEKKKKKKKSQTEKSNELNCVNFSCNNDKREICGRTNNRCTNYGGATYCSGSHNRDCVNTPSLLH